MNQISPLTTEYVVAGITFIVSVASSMFIAGSRWGEVRTDMRVMADRLAKIEGMFTLKLKDHDDNG